MKRKCHEPIHLTDTTFVFETSVDNVDENVM
jgi:hypothetical protein